MKWGFPIIFGVLLGLIAVGCAEQRASLPPTSNERVKQGVVDEQFDLAVRYAAGDGVPQDFAKAREWYLKAAKQGHVGSQTNLGALFKNGQGGSYDYEKAEKWLLRAATQGNATAQNSLGELYISGNLGEMKNSRARAWFQKSAKQGDATAQMNLGLMVLNGLGGAQDNKQGEAWIKKSGNAGQQAYLLERIRGINKSLTSAHAKRQYDRLLAYKVGRTTFKKFSKDFHESQFTFLRFRNTFSLPPSVIGILQFQKSIGFPEGQNHRRIGGALNAMTLGGDASPLDGHVSGKYILGTLREGSSGVSYATSPEKFTVVARLEFIAGVLVKKEMPSSTSAAGRAVVSNSILWKRIIIEDLTHDLKHKFKYPNKVKGVMIVRIEGEDLKRSGLQAGDVLQKVNRKTVNTVADYQRLTSTMLEEEVNVLLINRNGAQLFIAIQ